MQNPWLVQRCEMVGGRLRYDYVGSCEFEIGAQSESLRRIFKKGIRSGSCVVHVGGVSVAVFMVAGNDFVFTEYQPHLQQLADNTLPLLEKTYFDEIVRIQAGVKLDALSVMGMGTNAWFDIKNDVLWTLTRDNLELLVSILMSIKSKWSQEKR